MNLDELKLAESWEYIQGGFLFLDETSPASDESSLLLARRELKYYLTTLSAVDKRMVSLVSRLHLTEESQPFEKVPSSLKRMLVQDIAQLKEEPDVLDESYGSLALASFYRSAADYLQSSSPVPAAMVEYIRSEVHAALPDIRIAF